MSLRTVLSVCLAAVCVTAFSAVVLLSPARGQVQPTTLLPTFLRDGRPAEWAPAPPDDEAPGTLVERAEADSASFELARAPSIELAPTLTERLVGWPNSLILGAGGELATIFGFTPAQAREILFPISRDQSLAVEYRPSDLVRAPGARDGVLVRRAALADLEALATAANRAQRPLAIISGFRSYGTQAALFEARVRDRLAQGGNDLSPEEAQIRANQGTARPGHSQHQLGTALDFSTPAVGNRIGPAFAGSAAAEWLRQNAAEYGFVIPYTEEGRPRTGYIAEPWHLRWVGRPLAAFMASEGYLDATDLVADDYVEAVATLLDAGPATWPPSYRTDESAQRN